MDGAREDIWIFSSLDRVLEKQYDTTAMDPRIVEKCNSKTYDIAILRWNQTMIK